MSATTAGRHSRRPVAARAHCIVAVGGPWLRSRSRRRRRLAGEAEILSLRWAIRRESNPSSGCGVIPAQPGSAVLLVRPGATRRGDPAAVHRHAADCSASLTWTCGRWSSWQWSSSQSSCGLPSWQPASSRRCSCAGSPSWRLRWSASRWSSSPSTSWP